ncbi:GNAT family N-acetyltransferase [Spirochaeta isovalerica]|uniref:Ribosomal-protein-alanine N-acetyltransferase n=1 Tax=Spirochaeta isovalerica TaxID=150 RepID=A0A841R9E6_9SPIO|nr:GNAT family N-acetyltransferase [Spirochaeta isovalerica]MBB6480523.1 ribosomal-protein-alanine N-acetyltransferase [Spirochaeta isovalerica]
MIPPETLRNIPVLTDDRFIMRSVRLSDAPDMFEYGSDEEVVKNLPWGPYRSLEEVESGIEEFFLKRPEKGLPPAYAIVWKENGKMIGTCDFHSVDQENNTGGIGFVLNRDYWNRGIMTRASELLIEMGRSHFNFKGITLDHTPDNEAARRVAEKLGFTEKGMRIHNYMTGQKPRNMVHWEKDFIRS